MASPGLRVTNLCLVSDMEPGDCNPHENKQNIPGGYCRQGVFPYVKWTEKEIPQVLSALIDANSTGQPQLNAISCGAEKEWTDCPRLSSCLIKCELVLEIVLKIEKLYIETIRVYLTNGEMLLVNC